MEDQQTLVELKGRVINELTPLIESSSTNPEDKFAVLMLISRNSTDGSSLKTAFEAAKGIKDDDAKVDALTQLLEEIDFHLSRQIGPNEEDTGEDSEKKQENNEAAEGESVNNDEPQS